MPKRYEIKGHVDPRCLECFAELSFTRLEFGFS
jgi:hypothetical protein